jgi:MATE family multidrug resistance protein
MMPILLLLFEPLAKVFVLFGHEEKLIELERIYLFWLLFGGAAAISGEAAASYFRGQGKMRVEMFNNLFCVVLNIPLTYCFVFGMFGFPEWGLAGAAITTAFCLWVRFFIYVGLMFLHDGKAKKFHVLGGMRLSLSLLKRLGYYGVPAGFYTAVDTITFTAFILIIGGLGQVYRDATTIAFTLNSFTYSALWGIGIVVTAMVGNQLGSNRPDLARRATITALILGCAYVGVFGIAFVTVPNLVLIPFAQSEGFCDEVRALTIILLWFVVAYLLFDSAAIVFMSTLRGAGDTIFIAWAVTIITPFLPIVCLIGVYFFGFGVIWCWSVLTVYILVYCGVFFLRYRSKIWESKRVIEQELI